MQQLHATTLSVQWDTMLPSGGHSRQPSPGSWQNASKGCWPRQSMVGKRGLIGRSILPQLVRSQGSPLAGLPFTAMPLNPHLRFDPDLFRVLLLRRLRLPLPLSSRTCRCGRPLDSLGPHRASCCGCVGAAAARICREGGGRVSTNIFLRDLLPAFHGAQLVGDRYHSRLIDSGPHRRCADESGVALQAARRRKVRA